MDDNTQSNVVISGESEEQSSSPAPLPSPTKETLSMIDKADAVAKRIEEANKVSEKLLARQEAIAARMMLSGRAEAGTQTKSKEQTEKEKIKDEVDAALKRYR